MKTYSILAVLAATLLGAAETKAGAYVDAVLADNPSAYYRFEEASPTNNATANDSSADGLPDATYHLVPSPIAKVTGAVPVEPSNTALDFINVQGAGESQRVSVGAATGFAQVAPTGNFTIEWWAKVETSHAGVEGSMVSFTSATAGHYDVGYNYETDTPYVQVYPVINGAQQPNFIFRGDPNVGGTNASAPQHPDNLDDWFHYALVIGASDSSTTGDDFVNLYINAQLVGSMTGITNTGFGPAPYIEGFYMGQAYDDRQFLGQLDEVSVYQQALAPTQIATHYAAAVPEPATIAMVAAAFLGLLLPRRLWRA
jgi:hypothetical protein